MTSDFGLIQQNFTQYIVRPLNAFGLGGFIFDIEGDTTTTISTEITDHYTEDNAAVQDQIAVAPQMLTLKSYVGELVYTVDGSNNTPIQKAVQKLTVLSSYLPQLSAAAEQAVDTYEQGFSSLSLDDIYPELTNKALDLWSLSKNLNPSQGKQAQAWSYFKALAQQKILFSVQTPWEYMTNMAIATIVATQSADTKYVSDFGVTLKQMRFAKTKNTPLDTSGLQGRAGIQNASPSIQGKTPASAVNQSVLAGILDSGKNAIARAIAP